MKTTLSELDLTFQTRAAIDDGLVAEYAEDMRRGDQFPPVTVFRANRDATPLYLADGFHRVAAAKANGTDEIEATVIYGDRRAALTFALSANARHGQRRTTADKRRALEIAWQNRAEIFFGEEPSSRQLATVCCVSQSMALEFLQTKQLNDSFTSSADAPTAVTPTADHLEERNENYRRNLKQGLDRFGRPIPEAVLPAFLSVEPRRMAREVRRLRHELELALGKGDLAFAEIGQKTLIDLDNLVGDFKFGAIYCVCPPCRGMGCECCRKRGFLSLEQFRRLPKKFRS